MQRALVLVAFETFKAGRYTLPVRRRLCSEGVRCGEGCPSSQVDGSEEGHRKVFEFCAKKASFVASWVLFFAAD